MITCVKIHDLRKDPELARGTTVLVDRLWPRGVKKDAVHLDHWLKNVAPSPEPVSYTHLTLPTILLV